MQVRCDQLSTIQETFEASNLMMALALYLAHALGADAAGLSEWWIQIAKENGAGLRITIIALVLFISLKSLAQQPVTGVYYCSYDKQKAIRIDTLETGFVAKSSDLLLTYRNKQYNLKVQFQIKCLLLG